jgi:hypothetical protein
MQDLNEMSKDERHRIMKTIVGNDKTLQNIFENQYSGYRQGARHYGN